MLKKVYKKKEDSKEKEKTCRLGVYSAAVIQGPVTLFRKQTAQPTGVKLEVGWWSVVLSAGALAG